MEASRALLAAALHVGGIVSLLGAVRAGRRPRPVVRVVEPAVGRIQQTGRLVDRQHAGPLRRGIAAVHRFGPVESDVAPRNEVGMEVGDGAVGVGVDRVVRRVGVQLHRLLERLVALRLHARVRLRERLQRLLHQPDAHPFAVRLADDGSAVRAVDREILVRHAG